MFAMFTFSEFLNLFGVAQPHGSKSAVSIEFLGVSFRTAVTFSLGMHTCLVERRTRMPGPGVSARLGIVAVAAAREDRRTLECLRDACFSLSF
jgi:hypothetical protein